MNVLIIGATGKVGRNTVYYALNANHKVTAFGRSIDKIDTEHDDLTKLRGDVLNADDVEKAMAGMDVVILTFGAPVNKDTLFSVPDLCEKGTQIVIDKMYTTGVNRLVCMTAIGAGNSKGHGRFIFRNIIEPVLLGRIMEDRTNQEEVVKASSLNEWVIVRPTELDDSESKEVRIIENLDSEKEPETISRVDVGRMLVDFITLKKYDGKAILITN